MPKSPLAHAVLITIGALAVRLVGIGSRSLWLDEAFSAWLASQPVDAIVAYIDFHPPLYYVLLKAWSGLGQWATSDAGVRLPSALASAVGIGLAVWLVRRLALPGAWLVGLLTLSSSLSVWYAQEARMYALAGLATLGAAAALALAARPNPLAVGPNPLAPPPDPLAAPPDPGSARSNPVGRRSAPRKRAGGAALWLAYALSGALGVYLHYDALAVLLVLNLAFASAFALRHERPPMAWIVANAAIVLAYLPHLPRLVDTIERAEGLHFIVFGPERLAAAGLALWTAVVVAAALGLGSAALIWRRGASPRAWATGIAVAALLCLDVVELDPYGASLKRHAAVVAPIFLLAAGLLTARLRPRWQALLVAAGLPALFLALFVHPKEDWRGAADVVRSQIQPTDGLVVYRPWAAAGLERYYHFGGPILPANDPRDLAPLSELPEWRDRRVWLVESETIAPPTLAPYFIPARSELLNRQLPLVSVRLFGPAGR